MTVSLFTFSFIWACYVLSFSSLCRDVDSQQSRLRSLLSRYSPATTQAAIEAALAAKEKWARLDYESRAAITLKLAGATISSF